MGIFANFDIINSFQYGVDSVRNTRKAQATQLKSLDTLKDPNGLLAKDDQSLFAMQKVVSMHKAVESLRISNHASQVVAASIASAKDLNINAAESFTSMESTEEVNTTTSAATVSEPVTMGSTTPVTVSGVYDGSNGSGQLTVEVIQGGIHGSDDLQLQVYDADNTAIQTISISQADAIDRQYDLGNGLSITLEEGELLTGDRFGIDVTVGPSSHSDPTALSESTATASVRGQYDGSNGSGQLTVEVIQGGIHGSDDLQLQVYDADNTAIQTISISQADALDQQYDLGNGLSIALGAGEILTGDRFGIDVVAGATSYSDPTALSETTATASVSGEYDGSDGNGQLSIEVLQGGTHGTDDLQLKLYDANGNATQTFTVRKNDAIGKQYDLGNGLSLTLGAGELLTGDRINIEASQADSSYSTPTALSETTATAAISGEYDGSDGNGQLSIEVLQGGTHGTDDLQLQLYDANGNATQTFTVRKNDAIGKQYDLGNGLSLTLGAGELLTGDRINIEASQADSSYSTPTALSETTATAAISGEYDGSDGNGQLSIEVLQGGTHGTDDLQLQLYDANGNATQTISVDNKDKISQQYDLGNGLSLTLGAGELLTGDRFTFDATATESSVFNQSEWGTSSAAVTLGGEYDGSSGTGTVTFEVIAGGTHGSQNLNIRMFDADGNSVEDVTIRKNHELDQVYSLSNGMTLSLGTGDLDTGDTFTVDVVAPESSYSVPSAWGGADAEFAVGGTYDGSSGSGTLTFEVTQGGTHGTDDLSVAVFDADNNQIDTIAISSTDAIGQQYTLSNGLSLSLGEGNILEGSSFTLDVVAGEHSAAIDDAWGGADAEFAVGGTYDGSSGSGTLTFEVTQGGTHGTDDLSVAVFDADNNQIDTIAISSTDAIGQQYTLSNGLSLSLGEGNILEGSSFTLDVVAGEHSAAIDDAWGGADAEFAVGGTYDGSNGSGTLTFEVTQGGTHGTDDLSVAVFDADNKQIDTIAISSTDAIGQQYTLSNGLSLSLGEGNILEGSSFTLDVVAGEHSAAIDDAWGGADAEFAVGGTYDGSNGSGTLTFEVTQGGTHGTDDLSVAVFDADNKQIETIAINSADAADQQYTLSNGLTLSLSEGNVLEGSRFSVDVVAGETTASDASAWESSEAALTVGGTYDGSNGDDTLSLKVIQGGTHGTDDLQLSLYDSDGNDLGSIAVSAADPLNQQYAFSNGLSVSLGEGSFVNDTTFSIDVTASANISVDPDKAFNGTGADSANLEDGHTVTAGSFQINNVEITVNSDDSINSVLDRINNSAAGVTASFDSGSEKVRLTQNIAGPTQEISFANDTSGFLAATKLDTATAIPGELSGGVNSLITEVAGLESVQSGTLSINNFDIAIDINSDSLQDVLDRINSSDIGITASLNGDNDRISLTAYNNESIIIDSGETNFFEALEIAEGTHVPTVQETRSNSYVGAAALALSNVVNLDSSRVNRPSSGEDVRKNADSQMMATMVNLTADSMNSLFDDANFDNKPNATVRNVRNEIHSAIASAFGNGGPAFGTDVGVEIDFSKDRSKVMKVDQQRVGTVLAGDNGASSMRSALFGAESRGLFACLDEGLNKAMANLESQLGSSSGVFLDISA